MIGTRKLNSSRGMFVLGDNLVWKNRPAGNKAQNKLEVNDWVQGPIGNNDMADWSKYKGGDVNDPASYDIPSSVDPTNYPDL